MTNVGYEYIKNRIKDMPIQAPSDLSMLELQAWFLGASKMYSDIIKILEEMEKGQRDG